MPTPFFDTTNAVHIAMLPEGLAGDSDLANLAANVEAAVLAAYTVFAGSGVDSSISIYQRSVLPEGSYELLDALGEGIGVFVCLRGFDPDPTLCESYFAAAMRREIADALRWRWAQWRGSMTSASEGKKDSSKSYRRDTTDRLPPDFGSWLRPWDVRPIPTNI